MRSASASAGSCTAPTCRPLVCTGASVSIDTTAAFPALRWRSKIDGAAGSVVAGAALRRATSSFLVTSSVVRSAMRSPYGIIVVNWPAMENWIIPPQLHRHFEVLLSAGMLAICTVADPGAHGAEVTGMHGIGVSTPSAAAVAAATVGLAMDWHIANGGMFAMGLLSM